MARTRRRAPATLRALAAASCAAAVVADDPSGSCPAGDAGEGCRASAAHDWKTHEGCAIPAGDDVGEPEFVTLDAARQRCGALSQCKGFTFEGTDPEGPAAGGPVWVHFKERFGCIDADWVAYQKLDVRSPATAPPATAPLQEEGEGDSGQGRGVALCLTGQLRMLETTHVALEQNLLSVLQPEVLLYGPRDPGSPDGAPSLYGLEDYVVAQQWEQENIRESLYIETQNAGRVIDLEYLEIQGNWFGNQCLQPPLRDNRPGSAICLYYNQQKCLDMIEDQEEERGQSYKHVVVSRFDFRWVAPHPPLNLLEPADSVWIPSGSDWEGGVNDRHAVMLREHAGVYLGGWRTLTRGEAKDVMLETLGSMKVMGYPGPNTENYLKARLLYHNVSVARFPSVAYLTCTHRSKSRWTQCFGTATNENPGWLYKEEMEHATKNAQCVRSSWSQRKMGDCAEDISHLYRAFR